MNNLFRYELKKVCKGKLFLISVGLLMMLTVFISCLPIGEAYWVDETGTEVTGMTAIKMEKAQKSGISGPLTEERLQTAVENYQKILNAPNNLTQDEKAQGAQISNIDYAKYVQPEGDILNLLRKAFTPSGQSFDYYSIDHIAAADAANFYSQRMVKVNEYLDTDYSYGNYSKADKEFFIKQNEKIETPFYYAYDDGWTNLLSNSNVMLMAIVMVITICLAPMFSMEYQTGADSILLSSKYGKGKLITAKIEAALTVTTIIYATSMALFSIITLFIYGTSGWNCNLQTLNFLAPANANLLQTYLYVLAAGYTLCLSMQGITLLLSAKMASPFPVIICTLAFFFVPSFIPYSRGSRLFNNLLNLLPAKMITSSTALGKYEVFNLFGLNITFSVLLIVIALMTAFITIPFAYRSFRKHQVV